MTMDSLFTLSDSTYNMLKSNSFNEKTDTIRYNANEIYVSYLTVVNGCAEYKGDFFIKDDTIDLNLININDQACTEEECDRIVFRIKNVDNKNYKIIK